MKKTSRAGVSDTRAGLQPAGLFSNAGIFKKGFQDFHPLDESPYLLFDAESSMLGNLENPSLDLDASKAETLDVITATRAGIATFTAADGQIVNADPDTVRVDHVQGEELTPTVYQHIGYTDFSSGWSTYLGSTALGDGYNGQASLVCSFTGSGQSYQNFTSVDGVTYTGSFWARAVSASGPYRLVHGNSASGSSTFITLTSEWQFFSIQFLGRSGGGSMYFGIGATAGDVVEIAMPQVEEGTTATDFVPNTTGSPKFIASATYGPRVPMMLIEPSATNLVDNSTTFSTTGSVTQQSGIDAPDGTNTATRISNISGAPAVDALYSIASSITPSAEITGSIFLRGEAGKTASLYVKRYGSGAFSSTPAESVLLTGEWQRYESPSFTLNADNTGAAVVLRDDSNTTVDTIDVWGGQIEVGTLATSFIPTSGSAVTRNADNLVIDGTAFSDFYNATEGTFYMELIDKFNYDLISHLYLHGGGNNLIFYSNSGSSNIANYDGANFLQFTGIPSNQLVRMALSYASSTKKLSVNGNTTSDSTYNGNYAGISSLTLGTNLAGHIKRLLYWPTSSDSL